MTDLKLLNDPEYRWYHKEEMSKYMPSVAERKRMGIVTLDYEKLRGVNDSKIVLDKDRCFDWDRLKRFVDIVPKNLDKSNTKVALNTKDRLHFEKRDKGICAICFQVNHYGSNNHFSMYTYSGGGLSHLHHVIPNGGVSDNNIITLCTHCHQVVHQLLYLQGKWRYVRPL
jgi:hypothetical protein